VPAERYSLDDLLRVMARLRDPERGCPWDLQQDFSTIVPSTLEEAYELADSIEHGDFPHVAEELGDLMFQVVFYARMAEERGLFDFHEIVHTLVDKLVRRHPHVFAGGNIEGIVEDRSTVGEVKQSWEAIKKQERAARARTAVLDDIPLALPALSRAQKVQKRAATVGFDWTDVAGVIDKVHEELDEVADALSEARDRQEEEVGDLIFACVNLARHRGIDAEAALRRATRKFEERFNRMEREVLDKGSTLESASLEEMDRIWDAIKQR
jgi:ATP diphosphatase